MVENNLPMVSVIAKFRNEASFIEKVVRTNLEENEAGFGYDLYNLDQFIEKVLYMYSYREDLRKMGENGRRIAMERFNRNDLTNQALSLIKSVVEVRDIENDSHAK